MSEMDAYRDVFLAESADFLQQITDGLLSLESNPYDLEPVEVIFRGTHSLKGMAAAMGYERSADLSHKMEGLMDRVRKGSLAPDLEVTSPMLAAVDLMRDLIDDDAAGTRTVDATEMNAALEAAAARTVAPEAAGYSLGKTAEPDASPGQGDSAGSTWLVTVTLEDTCVLKAVRAYMVIKRLSHMGTVVETRPSERDLEDEKFDMTLQVVFTSRASATAIEGAASFVTEVASVNVEPFVAEPSPVIVTTDDAVVSRRKQISRISEAQTVRVAIGHLDSLVDLVGELVILKSRLERISSERADLELTDEVHEFQRISAELQYEVMQTRMVPVGNIFNRFPRMVRDLAIDLDKRVEFRMDGLDIELDRTVLDEIGDPLVHLLRNNVDHGIESPQERIAAGKTESGTITLSAEREREHVSIVVTDDGRGIDPERIWAKAVERGLVEAHTRDDFNDVDILQLTCAPGFTTVTTATRVSGRGVGLDVVKGKIEYLGGTVQIKSRVGHGTQFIMRLPLTLAIVQALLVEAGGQVFALPLSAVNEVIRAEDLHVDTVDGSPVVLLRDGEVVALRRLDAFLFGADPEALPAPRTSVVLLQAGAAQAALHVDGIVGRHEVVVKPLSRIFRDQKGFSGATILGDGRVMLILDPRAFSTAEA